MRKLANVFKPGSGYRIFFISMMTFGLSYGLYKGIIDNYLAEVVSMTSFDKGVSDVSFSLVLREIQGLSALDVRIFVEIYAKSKKNGEESNT